MNFTQLKHRVERREALVEARIRQVGESHGRLRREWRQAWSPLRIVVAGLVTGFIAGRAEPEKVLKKLGRLGGPRTLQLVTSVAGLVGSIQTAIMAMTARDAAEAAEAAERPGDAAAPAGSGRAHAEAPAPPSRARAAPADAAAPPPAPGAAPRPDRRRPDQRWDSQPSPAEAATELSER